MRARTRRRAILAAGSALLLGLGCELLVPADLTCDKGSVCEPAVPNGWTGPLTVYYGPPLPPTSACPSSMPRRVASGGFDLTAAPAECSCSCGGPEGEGCGSVMLIAGGGTECVPCPKPTAVDLPNGACVELTNFVCSVGPDGGKARSATIQSQVLGTGACAPAPTMKVPASSWRGAALACGADDLGSCAGGGACVAPPPAGFLAKPCIASTGDQLCPPGPYSEKRVTYAGVEEGRSCTPCTCGPADGTVCAVDLVTSQSSTACSGTAAAATGPGCIVADLVSAQWVKALYDAGGGSCPPDGGKPTGHASPTLPTTLCCLP